MPKIYTYMNNFTKGWLKYQNSYKDLTKPIFTWISIFTQCNLWQIGKKSGVDWINLDEANDNLSYLWLLNSNIELALYEMSS